MKTKEDSPPSHLTMTRQHLTAPASGFLNGAEKAAGIIPMVIIEPNPLLRDGLGRLLQETRYQVIGSSGSFANLVAPPNSCPEIALIGGDESALAVRALEDCRKAFPSARRVVLNDAQGEHLTSILTAGAHACLGRDVTLQALLMTLDLAMLGASLVCRPAGFSTNPLASVGARQTRDDLSSEAADVSHPLSTREVAILECLMHGDSNKLIARKFQIAEATVKVHIKAILRKIRAANRTQAAIWAMNHLGSAESRNRPEDIAML